MMEPVITKSPAVPQFDNHNERLDVSLRLIADYHIHTDQIYARMDVLILSDPSKQYNITLLTENLKKSILQVPKVVKGGISINVNSKDLIGKLRALADKLEKELPGDNINVC